MNITITHTASPELLNVLQAIFKGHSAPTAPDAGAARKQTAAPAASKDNTAGANTGTDEVTIETVRAAVVAKSDKKADVKKLLTEFGADRVTNLTKDQYAPFLAKVNAL